MVKGISRQVIVVEPAGQEIFDQAIFLLKENAPEISEDRLLQEAKKIVSTSHRPKRLPLYYYGPIWAAGGALLVGAAWLLTAMLY
ncbi:MAG: hypothetical protein ACI3W5_08020 [Faecousia sp.]